MHPSIGTIGPLLSRSHAVFSKVEIWSGTTMLASTNVPGTPLRLLGGNVDVATGDSSRRQCSLTVADTSGLLLPLLDQDTALGPYGNEIRVFRSAAAEPTNTPSTWAPLGVFRTSRAVINDGPVPQISLVGYDRARFIARNVFTKPWVVYAGLNYVTAIKNLVTDRLNVDVTWSTTPTTRLAPDLVFDQGDDPWAAAQKMASSIGYDLYFDVDGNPVLAPAAMTASPVNKPVQWAYTEGQNSIILGIGTEISDDPGYNGVVVYGENSTNGAIARGEYWDTDPLSPTNSLGKYGKVPKVMSSPYVTTNEQATALATTTFMEELGRTGTISLAAIPNPCIDLGDIVSVTRAASKLTNELVRVDRFNVPLSALETQNLTLVNQRTTS